MNPDQLASVQISNKSVKSSWAAHGWFGFILILYAMVEVVFLLKLQILISGTARLDFVLYACAFQVCFLASLFSFRRCLRIHSDAGEASKSGMGFAPQISILVMMLLLSIMMFSSFTSAYDKVKPQCDNCAST
jgi:hypothetical protein